MNRFVSTFRIVTGTALVAALFTACMNEAPVSSLQVNEPGTTLSAQKNARAEAHKSNSVKYKDTGVKPGTGREGSATLSVTALIAKDGSTLIQAVSGNILGATNVGNIVKTQLKVLAGDTLTKNFNKLSAVGAWSTTLTPGAASGTKIQVQANITGIDGKRTNVVTAVATAARRPDISVETLNGPAEGQPGVPVTFTALLTEQNGDVGARANCVLSVDGAPVDQATGIWIDADGSVSCMFTHTFETEGTYAVNVSATNVNPGDWDLANNTRASSITIAEPDLGNVGSGYMQAVKYDVTGNRNDYSISGNAYSYVTSERASYTYVYMNGNQYGAAASNLTVQSLDAKVRVNGVVVSDVNLLPTNSYTYNGGYYSQTCSYFDGLTSNTTNADTVSYVYSGSWAQYCSTIYPNDPASNSTYYYYQRVEGEAMYFSRQSYTSVYGDSYSNSYVQLSKYGTGTNWTMPLGSSVRLGVTVNGINGSDIAFDRTVTVDQDYSNQLTSSYDNTYYESYYGATIRQTYSRSGVQYVGTGSW